MTKMYVPMDLAFEHYAHVKQDLNEAEYVKICEEMANPRYLPVTEAEGYRLWQEGNLVSPDHVRVMWMHDVERPNDNFLARRMAEVEHRYGFRSSFNLRMVCIWDDEWRRDLDRILELGHEFEYQHEDLVITAGDQAAALESFRKNLALLRQYYPKVTLAFGHGVYKSGIDSAALFHDATGHFDQHLLQQAGLPPYGELYSFMELMEQTYGDRFHYFGESTCLGGDEFVAALRGCELGDVVMFLQHPTWWSGNYDFDELRHLMRRGPFFRNRPPQFQ